MPATIHQTILGPLTISLNEEGAVEIVHFGAKPYLVHDEEACSQAVKQMDEYLSGERQEFDLVLSLRGTPFQVSVWEELRRIPYGTTVSYRDIAMRIGRPDAVRAVGTANGANPIAIIVPCHRVIGANGSLTGYGGGLPNKRLLLELEQPQGRLV